MIKIIFKSPVSLEAGDELVIALELNATTVITKIEGPDRKSIPFRVENG